DEGAGPRLAAREHLFEHHGLEPLRRGIHSCRQPRRTRAHDGDVACIDVVLDADTDGAGEIGQARIDHDLTVVTNHDREARGIEAGLVEQTPPGFAVNRVETERHAEARHDVAQLEYPA